MIVKRLPLALALALTVTVASQAAPAFASSHYAFQDDDNRKCGTGGFLISAIFDPAADHNGNGLICLYRS